MVTLRSLRALVVVVGLVAVAGCVLRRPIEPYRAPEPVVASAPAEVDAASPAAPEPVAWRQLGTSVEGRAIRVQRVGHGDRRVLWIGGIHGNEREGHFATAALADAFVDAGLADLVTLTMIEDLNPDGSVANRRHNANGVDLNRNFPARSFTPTRRTGRRPLDQPEARVLHALLEQLSPDLVLVAHSAGTHKFINYDGPARGLAERFAALSGYPLVESDTLHATPGSLGSWVGRDLGIAILTLEYHRGMSAEVAWRETKAAILAVIGGVES